jgi:hypothetical protein
MEVPEGPPPPSALPIADGYSQELVDYLSSLLRVNERSQRTVLGLPDGGRPVPKLMNDPRLSELKWSAFNDMKKLLERLGNMALGDNNRVLLNGEPLVPRELHALAVGIVSIHVYVSGRETRGAVNHDIVMGHLRGCCAAGGKGGGGGPFGTIKAAYVKGLLDGSRGRAAISDVLRIVNDGAGNLQSLYRFAPKLGDLVITDPDVSAMRKFLRHDLTYLVLKPGEAGRRQLPFSSSSFPTSPTWYSSTTLLAASTASATWTCAAIMQQPWRRTCASSG